MRKAFEKVFPSIFLWNCAMHIKRNVMDRFGTSYGDEVIDIAKTYSKTKEGMLLRQLERRSKAACEYLVGIDPKVWRASAGQGDRYMPPRYGIVTSNGVEACNAMFDDAREGSWLNSIERSLYIMARRISQLKERYKDIPSHEIVGCVESQLKKNWESAANYDVIQTHPGEFHVNYNGIHGRAGESSAHIVIPESKECTCGAWYDLRFPCKHACAWARKWGRMAYREFCEDATQYVHKGKALKFLFHINMRLVIADNIEFDGITKPNPRTPTSGRPRKKRLRRRSFFPKAEDSTYHCSNCKEAGHNILTCTRPVQHPNRDIN